MVQVLESDERRMDIAKSKRLRGLGSPSPTVPMLRRFPTLLAAVERHSWEPPHGIKRLGGQRKKRALSAAEHAAHDESNEVLRAM